MSAITTHVLDTSRGCPASGLGVELEQMEPNDRWRPLGRGVTDGNGRLGTLLPNTAEPAPGVYRLRFETAAYYHRHGVQTFFPYVIVTFAVSDAKTHYHVPLLLSPAGYTTYRGS